MEKRKLVFATNNKHKLEEIRRMLAGKHEIVSLADIGCHDEIPEEQDTHRTFSRKLQADLFIDDRNLGGLPDWGVIYRMIHDKLTFEEVYGSKSLQAEAVAQQSRKGWLRRLFR